MYHSIMFSFQTEEKCVILYRRENQDMPMDDVLSTELFPTEESLLSATDEGSYYINNSIHFQIKISLF